MKSYKQHWLIVAFAALTLSLHAQDKQFTKTGKIYFDATTEASPENVEAVNKSVICVMDTKTGNIQFSLLVKGFEFQRALMQEHFNENYLESDKYPKSDFKGVITNNKDVIYTQDGDYKVNVKGILTIHGVSKEVETNGKLVIKNGKISIQSDFPVELASYKISIPGIVADKVAKTAKIKLTCPLEPLIK